MLKQTLAILMALFVGFASFVWVASFSSSFQSCISQEASQNAAEKGKGQNYAIVVVASHLRCAARFTDGHNGVITTIATVLLTFVTGGLVLTGYRQIQTSRAQLRAYIAAGGIKCNLIGRKFISHIEITNTGQTPAYDVTILTGSFPLMHPIGSASGLPRGISDGNPSVETLGAGRTSKSMAIVESFDWTNEEFEECRAENGWLRIYAWGTVKYKDVFGTGQHTNFCFYYEWNGTVAVATTSQHHNDAS